MSNLETGAHDALNAGLGLYKEIETQILNLKGQIESVFADLQANGPQNLVKSAEDQFNGLRSQLEKSYEELVAKGAADQSEQVVQLRGLIDQGIASVKDLQGKVESTISSGSKA
ncbi:MAG: hypothetical protein RIF32_05320 [Leptospirales bacterium]|jgi:hypothetical protein